VLNPGLGIRSRTVERAAKSFQKVFATKGH
jgi:hypothetical protein